MRSLLICITLIYFSSGCSTWNKVEKSPEPVKIEEKSEMKLCLTGDTGTGDDNQMAVANAMLESGCQYLVIAGDVIYPSGLKEYPSDDYKNKFLKPYYPMIKNGAKVMIVRGNHDHYNLKGNVWRSVARDNDWLISGDDYWVTNISGLCVVGLDITFTQKIGARKFLENTNLEDCDYRLAVTHYPYYSSGPHGDANLFRKRFIKRNILGKFDVYLSGHDHHLEYAGVKEGTHQILSGAGGKLRELKEKPRVWAESVLGYVLMTYSDESVVFEYRDVKNEVLFRVIDKR